MAFFLGAIVIMCAFVLVAASITTAVAMGMWLRWRTALAPFFRLSQNMRVWYRREQRKDWCTRCGQRLVFGLCLVVVQAPFFFFVEQQTYQLRTLTFVAAGVLFIRGVWGYALGGADWRRRRIAEAEDAAHHAFDNVPLATSAQAREYLMDIFTAERVVRLGVYTALAASFAIALAWDAGASSVLESPVLG